MSPVEERAERELKDSALMSAATSHELRDLAASQVVRHILSTRSIILPIGALMLTVIIILEPTPLKVAVGCCAIILQFAVAITDRMRLRETARPMITLFDVLVIVALQTAVTFVTGSIESPFLVAYMIAAFAGGAALDPPHAKIVMFTALGALWSIAAGGLFQVFPRTLPAFMGLESGFLTDVRYVVSKALLLTMALVVATKVGMRVNRSILEMIAAAIDARQQALLALQSKNRELVQLSSSIAHELKNPLASVQGLVQLLERGGTNSEKRFEVLKQEITRMRTTLDSFLNLSRPLGELTMESVSSALLFKDLTALHEGLAHAKGLSVAEAEETIERFTCDPRKLKEALTNLLQNAIEATPPGGKIAWIARKNGVSVQLGVEDSGPGIKPELLAKATELGVTTKPGGSGIGLAVARSIAEQHGGRLVLGNRSGGGCSAVIELPIEVRS